MSIVLLTAVSMIAFAFVLLGCSLVEAHRAGLLHEK